MYYLLKDCAECTMAIVERGASLRSCSKFDNWHAAKRRCFNWFVAQKGS